MNDFNMLGLSETPMINHKNLNDKKEVQQAHSFDALLSSKKLQDPI